MQTPIVHPEPEGATRPKRVRNSYPKEAKELLEGNAKSGCITPIYILPKSQGYWAKNQSTEMPYRGKRQELCARIKQIPGGEWCTPEGLRRWFTSKIKKLSNTSSVEQSNRDPRFPSLSKEALDNLGLLIKEHPVPSPDILALWSQLLEKAYGTTSKDVNGWVAYVHELVREESTSLVNKLPTPQSTATPEPQPQTHDTESEVHPMKLDPTQSPLLPKQSLLESPSPLTQNIEHIRGSPSSSISSTHLLPEPPEPFIHVMPQDYNPNGLAILSLIEAFSEDPSTIITEDMDSSPPASTDAFAMICDRYDPKLKKLLYSLNRDC
ncbi:hypothetical protein CPB83DRAFT_893323 [Crepidotus variabilis]|uniref:Uncharacterized protein n=1 Tax=Crepidotus variabilis TaxID=179855 RepID=A0A9P6EJ61_9AGAR|nr:hypothetical protein CPB83DRAFT_893323 [Crepidotus variabilis]